MKYRKITDTERDDLLTLINSDETKLTGKTVVGVRRGNYLVLGYSKQSDAPKIQRAIIDNGVFTLGVSGRWDNGEFYTMVRIAEPEPRPVTYGERQRIDAETRAEQCDDYIALPELNEQTAFKYGFVTQRLVNEIDRLKQVLRDINIQKKELF